MKPGSYSEETQNYRNNVGIMIVNRQKKILAGEAIHYAGEWMMPQGGIDPEETPDQALSRELYEETGLSMEQVKMLHSHEKWLQYRFRKPQYKDGIYYVGQRQKWFLLEYNGPLPDAGQVIEREFNSFDWVEADWLVEQIPVFKKQVYRTIVEVFSPLFPEG